MNRTQTFLSMALMLVAVPAMAQQVSLSKAQSRAEAFLQQSVRRAAPSRGGDAAQSQLSLAYTSQRQADQRPLYYVFNQGQNQGFIIVGGDEGAEQILGYCESGSFDYDKLPDNFRWWLSQYDLQISAGIDQGPALPDQRFAPRRHASSSDRHDIAPLIEAKWDQKAPYNNLINQELRNQNPGIGSYNFVTGCVATAMAQVMKHYNWPIQGTGQHTAPTVVYNGGEFRFTPSATFEGTRYDWGNMKILANKEVGSYSGSYTEEEAAAVATLMYHVGVSVDMKYGSTSGTPSMKIPNALATYFGYDKSVSYEERQYYTDDDWEDLVYNELANGRPVLYGGQSEDAGHQFICDGYRKSDGLYSFNWGWGRFCDGYYAITGQYALKPNGSGTGGAGADAAYTQEQDIVINVMPDQGGKELPSLKELHKGSIQMTVNDEVQSSYDYAKSSADAPAKVSSEFYNFSNTLTDFTLGVRAYDKNTGMIHYWACDDKSISTIKYLEDGSGQYYIYGGLGELDINLKDLTYNGTYEIRPVCRRADSSSDADWVLVKAFNTDEFPVVVVSGAEVVASKNVNFTISDDKVQVARTIQISHDVAYKGEITYSGYDNDILSVDANGVVTGKKVGSTTITVTGASYSINGNELFKPTIKQFAVSVIATVKNTPVVTIESTDLKTGGTTTIGVDGYEGEASAIVYSSSNTNVATVDNGTVSAVGAGSATITVNVPETTTSNAVSEQFTVTVSGYGIQIVEDPYLTNDADKLNVLNVKVKNVANTTVDEKMYAIISLGTATTVNYTYSLQFGAGASSTLDFDITEYESNLSDGDQVEYKFYHDEAKTIPFSYPSFTYTYHASVPAYSLSSAGWGTITMPVACDLPTGVDWKFYSCSAIEDGVLVLTEATTLERNTPYIVSGTAGTANFTNDEWVDSRLLFTEGLLSGVLSNEAYSFQQGDYILQKQQDHVAFYQVTADSPKLNTKASALRAFLRIPAAQAASNYDAVFFPEIEGISEIVVDAVAAGIYGMDGARRATLQPGMNIVVTEDGEVKKMFVK